MKRMCLGLIGLLIATTIVQAEDPAPAEKSPDQLSPFSLGVNLSYWHVPDLDEFDLNGAFGLGVSGQFRLHRNLALELRLSGFAAGESTDHYLPGRGWYEIHTDVVALPLEAGLLAFLPLGESFCLYGGPGIGYYLFDGEIRTEQGPWETTYSLDLDDEGGYYVLLGIRTELARNTAVFLEAKYTWVETALEHEFTCPESCGDAQDRPIESELDFSGVAINFGMLFTF